MEIHCVRYVLKSLGLENDEKVISLCEDHLKRENELDRSKRGKKRSLASMMDKSTQQSNKGSEPLNLFDSLERFLNRLPRNQGSISCVEDLFSFVSSCKPTVQQCMDYLNQPPFTATLAAFGKLPDQQYILVFDPYVQNMCFGKDEVTVTKQQVKEKLDEELVSIFKEDFRPTGIQCSQCGEQKFMSLRSFQKRSADEGSGYFYSCHICGHRDFAH